MISVDDAKKHPEVWLEKNRGLLVKIVNKFYLETPKFSEEDLMQEATIIALKAINKYEEGFSSKLSTYVYKAVERACRDYVRRNKYDLHHTPYQQTKDWKKEQAREKLPPPHFLAQKPEPAFGAWQTPMAIRLDRPHSQRDDTSGETFGDTIPSGDLSALDNLIKKEQVAILHEEINRLPEREKNIIYDRFFHNKTLATLAVEQGCSRNRINLISKRAMNKLSTRVKKRLEDELFV